MSDSIPRLRVFAGPNGSGKSTVKNRLGKPDSWFGIYINPDDLELAIRSTGVLSTTRIDLPFSAGDIRHYFRQSTFLQQHELHQSVESILDCDGGVDFRQVDFNSYHASVLSDFLRRRALASRKSITFESVMSAPDKVDFLREAQALGYRTYLYFIATEDPSINVQRVRNRVAEGGHDVPEKKIVERYSRSLGLLPDALTYTNRAFLFDSSEDEPWYFAEVVEGSELVLQSDEMPRWFKPIWDHFSSVDAP